VEIEVVREKRWALGPVNDNLELATIKVGTIGMVVGVAEPKTVLRLLVSESRDLPDSEMNSSIYHLSVLNLEPVDGER
jgi:hypothetical protein